MNFTAQLAGLAGVPAALARFGIPAAPLLAKAGLTPDDLQATDRRVSVDVADRLLGLCLEATGCEHFGLLAGACGRGLGSAGVVGTAARHAATVGDALADLGKLPRFHDPMGVLTCWVDGHDAMFAYGLHAPNLQHPEQFYDLLLALMRTAMRELCGPTWTPELVHLPRQRARDLQPYRAALGPHLKFNALRAALQFPSVQLAQPLADPDAARRLAALRRARLDACKCEPELFADLRREIRASLQRGCCSRAEVARQLGLHERALSRRLRSHGTTFREIFDETRFTLARELLRHTRVPVYRIARALGYRDGTVFGRAFRQRSGERPTEYRSSAACASRVRPSPSLQDALLTRPSP